MNVLLALLPAIGWGIIPLIVRKVKNSQPANQILGVGIGATLVGIIVTILQHPAMDSRIFILSLISGAFWTIGQIGQFISFTRIGVSKTMPISTGFQLVGNTIIGAIIFGEWKGINQYVLGILALILIIVGVALTAVSKNSDTEKITPRDLLFLLFTSVGYWIYSAFPKAVTASAQSLFLPQMIGILIGAVLYIICSKQTKTFTQRASWLDVLAGLAFGIGAYTYIISAQANGVTSAFIYSQLSVIISTVGGMTILGEYKHGKELVSTLIGLVLIVIGAVI
ncbi:GRP family sugar transporter [Lactobacillus sp. LL6]|uniref:GRP family sugar transporter n=1 Tax=Lactobacillus sp. LL6 TaxID=2596827 RepID=UPI0011862980|nr:GRP family sugar transporter [Lactobacillus sp. LL6]TSO26396.1 sugar transporter [Lactobacillus sp. LL6]